jgi:hypothetical protein
MALPAVIAACSTCLLLYHSPVRVAIKDHVVDASGAVVVPPDGRTFISWTSPVSVV